uniref:Uncharacterized protein n=1 Tax=Nelumbo nucifera TaxID=4432 RepID=A0A822Z0W9_NELNU|nr:TPA_asm: hypothetical protein HUJ06_014357 [Nelumbo nucifera]
MNPDGVLFSNGQGDPSVVPYAVETVKEMKLGHHGGNHPVHNLRNGCVKISYQACSFSCAFMCIC